LEKWSRALDPVLAQFVEAARGRPDADFWKSFFRYNSGSGPSVMTGWITTFFPYFQDHERKLYPNPYYEDWERRLRIDDRQHWRERWSEPQGVGMGAVPTCLTSVPLKVYWGKGECEMRLVGGLMGISQRAGDLTLIPECGWVVLYDWAPEARGPL
jgi:hypothetical protein